MKNPITELVTAQKDAINRSGQGAEKARRDYDERTKNDPNRTKVAATKRANERKAAQVAETLGKKAGIPKATRDQYTKPYR